MTSKITKIQRRFAEKYTKKQITNKNKKVTYYWDDELEKELSNLTLTVKFLIFYVFFFSLTLAFYLIFFDMLNLS